MDRVWEAEKEILSDIKSCVTDSDLTRYFTAYLERAITKNYLNSEYRTFFDPVCYLRKYPELNAKLEKIYEQVNPRIDKNTTATWYYDMFRSIALQNPIIKHISIEYPFKYERRNTFDGCILLETVFLDYTARFPFVEGTAQNQIARQNNDRSHRAANRQAKKEGTGLSPQIPENESFAWSAGDILRELIRGHHSSLRRIVLKTVPGHVDILGKSGDDLALEITRGLNFEPRTINWPDEQYFIWDITSLLGRWMTWNQDL